MSVFKNPIWLYDSLGQLRWKMHLRNIPFYRCDTNCSWWITSLCGWVDCVMTSSIANMYLSRFPQLQLQIVPTLVKYGRERYNSIFSSRVNDPWIIMAQKMDDTNTQSNQQSFPCSMLQKNENKHQQSDSWISSKQTRQMEGGRCWWMRQRIGIATTCL